MSTHTASPGAERTGARVVVVGSVNADLVARVDVHPAPGHTILGHSVRVLPGGKGANQAVAAAQLGSTTALVGAVGRDSFAGPALAGLQAAGVNLDALAVCDGATGMALITVAADGENTIVVIPGANATMDAEAVATHGDVVKGAGVVVLQGEIPRSGVQEAARLCAGRLVVNLAPVIDVDPAVLRAANPLVVNEHEGAAALAQLVAVVAGPGESAGVADGAPPVGAPPTDRDAALVRDLLACGVPSVVMTVGSRGAYIGVSDAVVHVPAPVVDAVDTTGAGDAFVGALAHTLAQGADLVDAARFVVRVGAFAVRSEGAQPSYPQAGDDLPEVRA